MSTPFPVKVGTNYKDTFYLKNKSTDAPITGKVQGDFTVQVSRATTGNLATTGITITEVDGTNNPGAYDIVASGSNSFTSTTAGKCHITVRLTADNYYTFEQTILLTSDGTFEGSSGAARFTATASDGRITDGSSPLTGATVRLLNSASTIVAQTTTDASGLWGPVFLDATVTIVAQKSGYSVNNSNSITVAGTTATGPATDVALTSVTSSNSILNSDLTSYARIQARNASGSQSDSIIQQAVNDSVAWVATAKTWEYYKTYGDFTLREPYDTGTLTLTNASTTVTGSGTTFPTWAASGKLKIGNKVYRISSRTNGTTLVLATAWAEDTESGTSYTLFQDEYSLASDCLRFGEPLPGPGWGSCGAPTSFAEVLRLQNSQIIGEAYPSAYAVHGSGNTAKVLFWPYPSGSEDKLLAYWYYRKPASLVNANDTVDCDPLHLELLHRAIDYQIAIRFETCVAGDPEKCMKRLQEALTRCAPNDKSPISLAGPLGVWRSRGPIDPRLTQ
jgi:hypothetical protein